MFCMFSAARELLLHGVYGAVGDVGYLLHRVAAHVEHHHRVENALLVALGQYSRYAALVLVSGLVCLAVVSIVNIVVDLLNLRDQTRAYCVK